jgi:hypothetical protein
MSKWLSTLMAPIVSAAFGDAVTFGATAAIRRGLGADGVVQRGSGFYGQVPYPQFVLEMERAVDASEEVKDIRAAEFRRLWGELEIVNALRESGGSEFD